MVNPSPMLASRFPEHAMELPSLASLHKSHKRCTAYKSFRQLVILHAVAEPLGFTIQTRQMEAPITLADSSGTPLIILDVYDWIGINERTFANHKSDLQRAYTNVQTLQGLVAIGHANAALQTKWDCWYPYTLPCLARWENSELIRYPALQWSWKQFRMQVDELHSLLLIVPSIPPM